MEPLDPNKVIDHCTWLTPAIADQIRLQWGLTAYVREEGGVYVAFQGGWCVTMAPTFGKGLEHGIEALLSMRRPAELPA